MSKASVSTQSYVFDPRPHYPLVSTAKRYWIPASPYLNDPDALTLIFAHGTGFHKEQWEPTIDELYELVAQRDDVHIREIWSLDAPNHGDAAVLNWDVLNWGYKSVFRWEDYARIIHAFICGLGTGVDVDFSKRRLVGVGHSMGSVAILQSLSFFPRLQHNFERLVLVEIMTMNKAASGSTSFLAAGASKRRDMWPSKEEAYTMLKARGAWKSWDDRVLRIYVNDGMVALPTREYPDQADGVTLKCTRQQETASYSDELGFSRAYRYLESFTKMLPIHAIYGAVDDYIPAAVKEDVIKIAARGNFASVSRVPNAGHLIPQQNPSGAADKILECLAAPLQAKSQL